MRDKNYVAAIFAQAPLAEIDALLADMLRSGDRDEASRADLFVQDAVMFGLSTEFAGALPRSLSLRALRKNMRADDYLTRHQCVHTLGRIGPRANAKFLADAFAWCLENDPFNLDDLLGELFWLRPRLPREPYIDAMVNSSLYLNRWSVISHLLDHGPYLLEDKRFRGQTLDYLGRLARDPHPRVRKEAAWRLVHLQLSDKDEVHGVAFDEPDAGVEPRLTFFTLEIHVSNFLAITGRRDYTLPLVERIAAHAEEHPTHAGIDLHAYWATFAHSEPDPR